MHTCTTVDSQLIEQSIQAACGPEEIHYVNNLRTNCLAAAETLEFPDLSRELQAILMNGIEKAQSKLRAFLKAKDPSKN